MTLSDTNSWIAVGAAIGSAAIALALAIVVVVLFIRLRRREPPANDVDRMLREADGRFELMLRDLSDQLERAREGARRSSRLSGLTSSIDLESVNRARGGGGGRSPRHRCGDARRPASDEEPLLVSAGMSRAEAERRMLPPAPDPAARSIGVAYRYAEEEAGEGTRVTGGLVVPLPASESAIGTLAVFWRGGAPSAAMSAELDLLEELAASAGPAVENAIKFRDASRLADLDALTGLHNRRFFHETLGRECDRAARYERRLALLVFDVDDFQGDQRRDRTPRWRHGARPARRSRTHGRSDVRCRLPGRRRRVRGHPPRVVARRRGAPLPPTRARRVRARVGPGRPPRDLGRRRRASAGRHHCDLLRTCRRGSLPREAVRQGPGYRGQRRSLSLKPCRHAGPRHSPQVGVDSVENVAPPTQRLRNRPARL